MLHIEELAAWLEDPLDLLEALDLVTDGAEDQGHDHGVTGGVLHPRAGQVLPEPYLDILDVQLRELGPILVEPLFEVMVGLHGLYLGIPVVKSVKQNFSS